MTSDLEPAELGAFRGAKVFLLYRLNIMSGPSLRDCQVSANNGNCREKINPSETVRCEINLRSATSNLNQQNLISFHLFTACFADGKNKAKWQKGKELSFITEITFGSECFM